MNRYDIRLNISCEANAIYASSEEDAIDIAIEMCNAELTHERIESIEVSEIPIIKKN